MPTRRFRAAWRLRWDIRRLREESKGTLSGRPDASYELRWYAHVMARWLDTLKLSTVDVVGHSFGGGVAQTMLLECPERIRRLGRDHDRVIPASHARALADYVDGVGSV